MKPIPTFVVACVVVLAVTGIARAHELRPAYLELRQSGPETFDVLWKVPARGDLRLGLYVRFPDTCQELQERVVYSAENAFIERWQVECPGGLAGQSITIDGLSTTLTDVLVRLQWSSGATETVRLTAEKTSFVVEGSPSWYQVAGAYTSMGIEHILLGVDHLLFVLGLLLIVRGIGRLVKTIAKGQSFLLPSRVQNLGGQEHDTQGNRRVNGPRRYVDDSQHGECQRNAVRDREGSDPWIVAFAFGLLHGLGFAGALTGLGLPSADIPLALLFFNVGVEMGQLLFVLFFAVLAWAFRTLQVVWPKWSEPVPAYAIGTLASYWLIGRFFVLIGF